MTVRDFPIEWFIQCLEWARNDSANSGDWKKVSDIIDKGRDLFDVVKG